MVAQVFDLLACHGQPLGVEEVHARFNEGNEEQQVQRCHHMRSDL